MSVQRSPPKSFDSKLTTPSVVHYASDSAINELMGESTDSLQNISKRQKRTLTEYTVSGNKPMSNVEIISMIAELKTQQQQKFDSLTNTMQIIVNQNQEIQKSMDFISNQYEDLLHKIANIEQENCSYKKQITNLESKLELLEKNSRNSTIEIRNIPIQNNENRQSVRKIVKDIASVICPESPIEDYELRDIFRTKSTAIVVEFTTTNRRESMISDMKEYNKTRRQNKQPMLDTQIIGLPGPKKVIYMSEFLTAKTKRIFYLARELVKNKKLAAAWTSYGKIYVKREENKPSVRIDDEADLSKVSA